MDARCRQRVQRRPGQLGVGRQRSARPCSAGRIQSSVRGGGRRGPGAGPLEAEGSSLAGGVAAPLDTLGWVHGRGRGRGRGGAVARLRGCSRGGGERQREKRNGPGRPKPNSTVLARQGGAHGRPRQHRSNMIATVTRLVASSHVARHRGTVTPDALARPKGSDLQKKN